VKKKEAFRPLCGAMKPWGKRSPSSLAPPWFVTGWGKMKRAGRATGKKRLNDERLKRCRKRPKGGAG